MLSIKEVYEEKYIKDFLIQRRLLKQYLKVVKLLKDGVYWKADFKERQPKWKWIYSFRINKQFRAIWSFDTENDFIVSSIDNHQ